MTYDGTPGDAPQPASSTTPPPPPPPGGPPAPAWSPAPYDATMPASTNGFAIASMVLGIVGFMCLVGAILALVFGYKARREIDASGGRQQGRGMAITGIVLGWVWIAVTVVVVIAAAARRLLN